MHACTLLLQIRQRVGGDRQGVDLGEALIAMPGPLTADRVFPATPVRTGLRNEVPVDVAALEAALRSHPA